MRFGLLSVNQGFRLNVGGCRGRGDMLAWLVRTHFTSSRDFSTAAWSERSSLTMCGGDAREKPVPTASQSFDSENVRRTCLPSRPVAPVMSAVGGISIFD